MPVLGARRFLGYCVLLLPSLHSLFTITVLARVHVICQNYFFLLFFLEKHNVCTHTIIYQYTTGIRSKISFLVGPQEPLLAAFKRQKLVRFGPVMRHNSLSKTFLQDTSEGGWRHGWQRKCWMDNVKECTYLPMPELLTVTSHKKDWKKISAKLSFMSSCSPDDSTVQETNWTEHKEVLESAKLHDVDKEACAGSAPNLSIPAS